MLFLFVQVDIISHFGDKKQKYIAEFTTVRECLVDKLSARCANERLSFVFVYFFFSIPLIINNTCDILWYRFSSMHIIKKWIWSCAPHQSPLVHFVYIIYDLCRLKFIARYFWTAVHSAEMCVCGCQFVVSCGIVWASNYRTEHKKATTLTRCRQRNRAYPQRPSIIIIIHGVKCRETPPQQWKRWFDCFFSFSS